ncbi:MAG: DUF6077 domain-containing protein [Oryzihumus sp.]
MPSARPTVPSLRAVLDHGLDVSVALVAWWSVFYWVGLATQWSLWPSGWLWLVTSPVVAVLVVRLGRDDQDPRRDGAAGPHEPGTAPWLPALLLRVPGLVWVAATLSALLALACLGWPGTFKYVWVLMLLGVAAGMLARGRDVAVAAFGGRRDAGLPDEGAGPAWRGDVAAALLALAIAALSLFINLPDGDDPFYVNRSLWVAQHGNASLLDTMFGPQTYPTPYNGGLPIASIEALIGVVAHMTHLQVGTITWILLTFVASFMTVWAFWRLARTWARRTPLLVLVVAVAFMLMSGESRLGNFWIARIWQGKVLALVILVPLIWVWATDLVEGRRTRRSTVMLFVAGAAFVGLTSTAVILGPMMTAAMLVGALLLRNRRLAVGGVLLSVAPVLSGIAVVLTSKVGGAKPAVLGPSESFLRVFGPAPVMVALALAGLVAGMLVLRSPGVALVVGAAQLGSLLIYLPGLLPLLNRVTGAGPVLWRTFYCVPTAVLLGLVVTAWPPARVRTGEPAARGPLPSLQALVVPVLVLAAIVAGGAPLWTTVDHNGPVTVTSRPTWKLGLKALADVRAVEATHPHGVVLLPPLQMRIMPMYTTEAFSVVPRVWYAKLLHESPAKKHARFVLSRLASKKAKHLPGPVAVARSLDLLHVTLACTGRTKAQHLGPAVAEIAGAGFGDQRHYGRMVCLRRSGG